MIFSTEIIAASIKPCIVIVLGIFFEHVLIPSNLIQLLTNEALDMI